MRWGVRSTPSVFSRDASLLPSRYADTRYTYILMPSSLQRPKSELVESGNVLASALNCGNGGSNTSSPSPSSSPASVLECMRAANASSVFGALLSLSKSRGVAFQPCYGCVAETPVHPLVSMRDGNVNRGADIIVGNARYEHGTVAAHGAFGLPNSSSSAVTKAGYETAVARVVKGNASRAAAAVELYAPLVKRVGFWYALATMNSHSNVICVQQAQSRWFAALPPSARGRLYRYVFTHSTHDWPQRYLNATHCAALPYLYRNSSTLEWFLGYGSFNVGEQHLSNEIAMAWKNFALRGDPGVDGWAEYAHGNVNTLGGSSNDHDRGANLNFTYVFDSDSPKAIEDGQEWEQMNAEYCEFWKETFIGPFGE